jgi:hypothetical protein
MRADADREINAIPRSIARWPAPTARDRFSLLTPIICSMNRRLKRSQEAGRACTSSASYNRSALDQPDMFKDVVVLCSTFPERNNRQNWR